MALYATCVTRLERQEIQSTEEGELIRMGTTYNERSCLALNMKLFYSLICDCLSFIVFCSTCLRSRRDSVKNSPVGTLWPIAYGA